MQNMIIRLSTREDPTNTYDLWLDLIPSNFLQKWITCYLRACQRQDRISEPWAFYNLNSDWTADRLVDFINLQIDACNAILPGMFDLKLTSIDDQDALNQIHSIFEITHGKLDEWLQNPLLAQNPALRDHLSHINQAVHRCETHGKGGYIRIVYFDLPKTETFTNEDYQLFTNTVDFGGLYTLYADVGKNIESLATDNDHHHHDFVPNLHYSVDCKLQLHDQESKSALYQKWLDENWDYFDRLGYKKNDPKLTTGSIKLAQLRYTDQQQVLNRIQHYNNIQQLFVF